MSIELPRADDPDSCAAYAVLLLARARTATGWWNRRARADLLAQAAVYAALAAPRTPRISTSAGRPLPRRNAT